MTYITPIPPLLRIHISIHSNSEITSDLGSPHDPLGIPLTPWAVPLGLVSPPPLRVFWSRALIWQQGSSKTLPSLLQTFWGQVFLPRRQEGRKEAFLLLPCCQVRVLAMGRTANALSCLAVSVAREGGLEETEDVDLWYLPVPNRRLSTCPGWWGGGLVRD